MRSLQISYLRNSVASRIHSCLRSSEVWGRCYADERGEADGQTSEEVLQGDQRAASGLGASTSQPELPARKKGKRPTRAEKGSWVNNAAVTEALLSNAPVWPTNQPFYDVQSQAPWLTDLVNPIFESYKRIREDQPRLFERLHSQVEEDAPPREGAQKILRWEINVVFESGPLTGEAHPLNKKVKCRIHLRDLQQECGLSDKALQHIALICGPRYDPRKGILTLTSEKYSDREENRLHIVDMVHKLVDEGHRAHPALEAAAVSVGSG